MLTCPDVFVGSLSKHVALERYSLFEKLRVTALFLHKFFHLHDSITEIKFDEVKALKESLKLDGWSFSEIFFQEFMTGENWYRRIPESRFIICNDELNMIV